MPTPTAVLSARERLIKSILHWVQIVHNGEPAGGPQIAAAVAADLFGDLAPDITPAPGKPSSHIGPIGDLALWVALYWEEWGLGAPDATIPSGIMINPQLLIPLLALHPTTFEAELYHKLDAGLSGGKIICKQCKLDIVDHFEALQRLHVAEIESLTSDIALLEATTDIQMQAIVKGTEAIEGLTAKVEALESAASVTAEDVGE